MSRQRGADPRAEPKQLLENRGVEEKAAPARGDCDLCDGSSALVPIPGKGRRGLFRVWYGPRECRATAARDTHGRIRDDSQVVRYACNGLRPE